MRIDTPWDILRVLHRSIFACSWQTLLTRWKKWSVLNELLIYASKCSRKNGRIVSAILGAQGFHWKRNSPKNTALSEICVLVFCLVEETVCVNCFQAVCGWGSERTTVSTRADDQYHFVVLTSESSACKREISLLSILGGTREDNDTQNNAWVDGDDVTWSYFWRQTGITYHT